jgi:RNA polymerase sigma factor (sigma-70 family)
MSSAVAERPCIQGEDDLLLNRPVPFVHHATFEAPGAEELILTAEPEHAEGKSHSPGGGPAGPLLPARVTPLDAEEEQRHFRMMNYLFFRAEELRQQAFFRGFEAGERKEMKQLIGRAEQLRNLLVVANLGLVVTRAAQFLAPGREMADLLSEGNFALVRAVGTFDFSQNVRFSSYLCTALDRTLLRFVRGRRQKDPTNNSEGDGPLATVVDHRATGLRKDAWREELRKQVPGLLGQLGERERLVIEKRFGLDGAEQPATLNAVGRELDVSEERVRQLEKKALDRLKGPAMQLGLEPFEE